MKIQRELTAANIQEHLELLDGLPKAKEFLLPFTLFTEPDDRPSRARPMFR